MCNSSVLPFGSCKNETLQIVKLEYVVGWGGVGGGGERILVNSIAFIGMCSFITAID